MIFFSIIVVSETLPTQHPNSEPMYCTTGENLYFVSDTMTNQPTTENLIITGI